MIKILCIEDDKLLAQELSVFCKKYQYDCIIAENFEDILSEVERVNPQLILLDINLPYHDGFYWCREIRKKFQIPIIMLSSRDTRMDQVMGMTIGADDYLTKPIDLELLLVKIQVILRRAYDYNAQETSTILEIDGLELDTQRFLMRYVDKEEELTKNETKILQKLIEHKNEFVRRDLLMDYLWDNESFIDENTLNVNISRLRKKIFEMTSFEYIETKRSVGYKIARIMDNKSENER